ncbi:MAG: zinc-binding dehydrogenase [Chitinophagaceae bacterium]
MQIESAAERSVKNGRWVVFNGPGLPFEMNHSSIRPLQPGEVLVRNLYTTICGSDLHTFCGVRKEACPTVLGHEIVGEVIEIHPTHTGFDHKGKNLNAGDLVTWSVFSSNPQSPNALEGIPQKGDDLFKYGHAKAEDNEVFHGGLAEYCILKPNTAILKIPQDMPLPIAATLNCAIATVAGSLRLAGDLKDKNVLITGMGLLGIACAAMCRDAGAEWIGAADIADKRLEEALGFGADETMNLNGNNQHLVEKMTGKFPRKGIDVVFDMSGSPDAMEFGLDCLAIGGRAIWVGAVFNNRKLQVDAEKLIRNLLTIKGLHNYNYEDYKYAVDFMKRNWKKYPFENVVEKEFSLEQAQQAFEYALQYKPLRVGIKL